MPAGEEPFQRGSQRLKSGAVNQNAIACRCARGLDIFVSNRSVSWGGSAMSAQVAGSDNRNFIAASLGRIRLWLIRGDIPLLDGNVFNSR